MADVALSDAPVGVEIRAPLRPEFDRVLTPEALTFLVDLARRFEPTRRDLMDRRAARQLEWDAGALPDFLKETTGVREADWSVADVPEALTKRWVEITGPTDRKMMINALNSGADVFMADLEDSLSPTWDNVVEGQTNLMDYGRGALEFTDPRTAKHYEVGSDPAILLVRPRGWHLPEEHVIVDGAPIAGALFDFGLRMFHGANGPNAEGFQPFFYLPKLESHLEARLWNDVFEHAQKTLGLPSGTIKATVLIETLPAAFEMDEILYELRDHIVGLNCGRWDYIFSFIKVMGNKPDYLLPDRGQVLMGKAFLHAYSLLLIQTCHKRGAFAMGGMAAQIPSRKDAAANDAAMAAVMADKEREVRDGHDGTWVAHPDLVPVARQVFERFMPGPNQLSRSRDDVAITQADLLRVHDGTRTEQGLRTNIRVGVQYIEAWLRGNGAVPLYNLMEDAATAEISRAQIWQWLKHGAELEGGMPVTAELVDRVLRDEMAQLRDTLGADLYDSGRFPEAIEIFKGLTESDEMVPFLTLPAYRYIV